MSFNVVMPKAGLTMTEGTISEWKKSSGEQVHKDELLLVIENEKSSIDVNSQHDGILYIISEEGAEVPIGETIAMIAESQAEYDQLSANGSAAVAPAAAPVAPAAVAPTVSAAPAAPVAPAVSGGRVFATPLARKVALAHNVTISAVSGTGPNGRILEKDVLKYIESAPAASAVSTVSSAPVREPVHVPLTKMRKVIGRRMMESLQTMAQVSASVELDVTELMALKEKLAARSEELGVRISLTDLFGKILVKTVQKHTFANSELTESELILYPYVNLSIAVATEAGLQVPVVKNADQLSLLELSKAIKEISKKTRDGKLSPDDMSGGTITLSNVSMFPVDNSTPIINAPQTTILGLGRVVKKPVVKDDEIVIRSMMNVFMTYDHRAFDGSEACHFLQTLKDLAENPEFFLI